MVSAPSALSTSVKDDDLRRRIVEAATRLIAAQGYTGTTSDQIAKACQISKKTLYRIVPTKESLLQMVIDDQLQSITADTDAIYARPDLSPRERIALVMERMLQVYGLISSPTVLQDVQRSAPAVWPAVMTWRADRAARFNAVLGESLESRELRDRLSKDDLHAIYDAFLSQSTQHLLSDDPVGSASDIYRTFLDVFFHGVLTTDLPTEERT